MSTIICGVSPGSVAPGIILIPGATAIRASCSEPAPFGVATHPFFRLPDARVDDIELLLPAGQWLETDSALTFQLGTTTPERVTKAAAGADVELTRPEWYELYRAAGYLVP